MKTIAIRTVVVLVALSVCLAPVAWAAEKSNNENPASDIGLGVASFLCSVPYGAAKVALAIVGGVTGSLTYVFSGFDKKAADAVWYTTIEGDYVVTPDHLRGKKDLRFTGVPPDSKGGR
ncbi:MAG: hypothetical protein Q7R68_11490 [Nitrospirales bacterium]|nr:hypothetical protein [Nitrospirales bacterium]